MAERAWLSRVRSEFMRSPLVSNAFFGFVLTGLEKLVEAEFACPCDANWNAPFTAAFFAVPALLVFLLMISIQGCKEKTWPECVKNFLSSIAPALVWLTLLYFDGRYYVCYETNWSGRFVFVPEAAPKKWCKPTNSTSSPEDELQKTLQWYSHSEVIGMRFVISLTVFVALYVIARMFKCICNIEVPCIDFEGDEEPGTSQ